MSRSADGVAPSERRRSVRHAVVREIAKLITSHRQELCVLRDVSPDGLKAEIYCPIDPGERVTIELRTGHSMAGVVRWCDEDAIGVAFDRPVPVLAMLSHCSIDARIGTMRPPRLDVDLWGMLAIGDVEMPVRSSNISQAGMKIEIGRPVAVDAACRIALDGLAPRPATIRWARDGEAGLMLAAPLTFDEFADWRRSA